MRRAWILLSVVLMLAAACSDGTGSPWATTVPASATSTPDSETTSSAAGALPTLPLGCSPEEAAPLMTGTEFFDVPEAAEPPPREWYRDPTYGSCVVRVTNRDADLSPEDGSPGITPDYSRVPAFNADGTRFVLRSLQAWWYLYDATTLEPLGTLPLEVEPRWDASDPGLIYHISGTRLLAYDLDTGESALVHDFAQDLPGQQIEAVWTREEGVPSADGRYWGFMAQDQDWQTVAFLVYDRQTDQVTVRDVRGLHGITDGIDHVTMSPLGTFFLASFDHYCEAGSLGTDAEPCGLMVYDRGLQEGRSLVRIIGHHDPALTADGREVVVFQDIDHDEISMVDLADGQVTPLLTIDFTYTSIGLHFSGLGTDRPGWAVISTYDDDLVAHTWMDDQVFLVELAPAGRVVRLAFHHSISREDTPDDIDYFAEPHATTNRSITRILFGSNWGSSGTGHIETYMIALPPDWPDLLASGG